MLFGLHHQTQHVQGKLLRVTKGPVFDKIVDIRQESPPFGKWFGVELSAKNKKQLWVPKGLAHGYYLVTSESAEFIYKTADYYPEFDCSILWSDPAIRMEGPPLLGARI